MIYLAMWPSKSWTLRRNIFIHNIVCCTPCGANRLRNSEFEVSSISGTNLNAGAAVTPAAMAHTGA